MIEPFYFGTEPQRLFGIHHPPAEVEAKHAGVVLCYPAGQEYIRAHRAFRRLAEILARQGFPVLRFDFYGCGDSPGASDEGTLRQWVADIATAIEELRTGEAARVVLVGLRLGATLAALCGAQRGDVEAVVLWEPVVHGGAHVQELQEAHRAWLAGSFAAQRSTHAAPHAEAVGFPLSQRLKVELQECDLLTVESRPARYVHVVADPARGAWQSLTERLADLGATVSCEDARSPCVWQKNKQRADGSLVPVHTLERIAQWISRTLA